MSATPPPRPRPSPAVYRRRRLVALIGLFAVIALVVLLLVRPGFGSGEAAAPSAAPPVSPTAAGPAPGAPCTSATVRVDAVTDAAEYAAGVAPKLSVTLTNTGTVMCVINAGTARQVFSISSGSEVYWRSTDCQTDATDAQVQLQPGQPVSSAAPIVWDRTRSSRETCNGVRDSAPAAGASYHLSVSVDGISSTDTRQFLLN